MHKENIKKEPAVANPVEYIVMFLFSSGVDDDYHAKRQGPRPRFPLLDKISQKEIGALQRGEFAYALQGEDSDFLRLYLMQLERHQGNLGRGLYVASHTRSQHLQFLPQLLGEDEP